jgi:DNA-binding NarL/FixJ family response regulator
MKPTVLIVDSHDLVRQAFEFFLADAGYDVLAAGDGAGAEECLERRKVDVVLLDPLLPDVEGMTLLRGIRRDRPGVPVIIVSMQSAVALKLEALRAGAWDYVDKMLGPETVKESIERALDPTTVTGLPGPVATKEVLETLLSRGECAVLLVRLADEGLAQRTANCLALARARFAGQWTEDEFVLILDPEQAEDERARIRETGLPVSMGIACGATVGDKKTVDAILTAAREKANQDDYLE